MAGLTAWQGLVEYGRVDVGDRVLVLGGAGGVGALAVQFALQLGAQVTATTMGRDVDYVQALGLVEVLVSESRESHSPRLRKGTFDVVLDTVGGTLMEESIALTRRGGTFITLQQPPPTEPLEALGVDGIFFVVRSSRSGLNLLRDAVDRGQLAVTVAATYPLAEGRTAYESGALPVRSPGKTVLVVNPAE